MIQLRRVLLFFVVTTLRVSERYVDGSEQNGPSQQWSRNSREDPPADLVYVPHRGSWENLLLSTKLDSQSQRDANFTECKALATTEGVPMFGFMKNQCVLWKLDGPVCSNMLGKETQFFIKEEFLTDGSPNDDPFPSPNSRKALTHSKPHVAFRIMTPTITEIPGFSSHGGNSRREQGQDEGMYLLSKLGGIVETSSHFPIDPTCYTNSLCGVAVFTSSTEMFSPNVTLHKVCGQTMDLENITALNVFSHEGIGCKFFPCVYPTRSCELTVTSCHVIEVKVTLVNFKKTTCEGYELKVLVRMEDGAMQEHDLCKNDIDSITANSGEVKILFSGSPSSNWQRYGFNIRFLRLPTAISSPQCSGDTSS